MNRSARQRPFTLDLAKRVNPPTADTIALGRRLYYDPQLSVDNTIACAGCHSPDFGFTDGKQFSTGVGGKKGGRNAPAVFNAAYYTSQFWDGRAPNRADPSYREQFERAFGAGPITYDMVAKSIASFERTVISGNSPFDRFFYGGDEKAINEASEDSRSFARRKKAIAPLAMWWDFFRITGFTISAWESMTREISLTSVASSRPKKTLIGAPLRLLRCETSL